MALRAARQAAQAAAPRRRRRRRRSSGTIVAVARGAARRRRAARGRRARQHRFLHIACLPGQTDCVRRFCTSELVEPAVAGARLVLGRRDAAAARSGGRLRGRLSRAARQVRTELASDFAVFYWRVRLTPCSLPHSLLYLLCCCLLDSGADLATRNARGETALPRGVRVQARGGVRGVPAAARREGLRRAAAGVGVGVGVGGVAPAALPEVRAVAQAAGAAAAARAGSGGKDGAGTGAEQQQQEQQQQRGETGGGLVRLVFAGGGRRGGGNGGGLTGVDL